jgi:hypothetical protein
MIATKKTHQYIPIIIALGSNLAQILFLSINKNAKK